MRVSEVVSGVLVRCEDAGGSAPVEVMTDLVGELEPGDEVLVHAGVALLRLS
jgi:hydrogenase maturation factor